MLDILPRQWMPPGLTMQAPESGMVNISEETMYNPKLENIEFVNIDELIPHPKNMHIHSDAQIDRLIKLIEYQGMRNTLGVQRGTN